MVFTRFKGHWDRSIDHVEAAEATNLTPLPTQFLAQSITVRVDQWLAGPDMFHLEVTDGDPNGIDIGSCGGQVAQPLQGLVAEMGLQTADVLALVELLENKGRLEGAPPVASLRMIVDSIGLRLSP